MNLNILIKLEKKYLLSLICAAAVLRFDDILEELILHAKSKRISNTKLYEALLQNYLFAGYPSAIISLKILNKHIRSSRKTTSDDMNLYHFKDRGEKNCKTIYGNKYEKLIANVNSFSPELAEWLVLEGYGKVLGREGLSYKERELCIVSVLTVLKFEDQLYSHINGALRVGARVKEIDAVIENLSLLGKKSLTGFGKKVLKKYMKSKGV
ncbi:MAG: carboxymuconolactone decarboxylase family protein [Ignavibacteriaceae bacterium]|nr:carboxymuconolactone decarboxylase family protein [Ignavibacteriaceae bacterium]